MFYAQFVLAKKGPLAKIWLAAHWEKKLTKAQIYETDVPQAIEEVIRPKVKMALRTVGHLLLGIVRIYSKKTRYLLADTNEAYLKMKVNFRDGFTFEADLPLDAEIDENFANFHDNFNITVPEFHDADYNEQLIMANVSRLEDITLKDDVNFNAMFQINVEDDGFGDEGDFAQLENLYGSVKPLYGSVEPSSIRPTPQPDSIMDLEDVRPDQSDREGVRRDQSGNAVSKLDNESILLEGSVAQQAGPLFDAGDFGGDFNFKMENQTMPQDEDMAPVPQPDMFSSMVQGGGHQMDEPMDYDMGIEAEAKSEPVRPQSPESFALEPLDLENLGDGRKKRQRKPRKLLVDAETMISDEAFRAQQEDFSDTMQAVQMAPPTRKMMNLCVSGDLQHLMSQPGCPIGNREILAEYRKCLVLRQFDPNFTIHELSESSSFTPSMERQAAPWEDLDLNENLPDDLAGAPAAVPAGEDDYYNDVDMYMGENYDVAAPGGVDFNRTLEQQEEGSIPDYEPMPGPAEQRGEFQNKENEEEDWSDPFGSSFSSRRGRLEAYGFGSAKQVVEDEGKWAKRAAYILRKISTDIETAGQADFSTVTSSAKTRKQAAEQFYSLLTLAKSQAVRVEQAEPYGEIVIRAGEKFSDALNPVKPTTGNAESSNIRTPMRPI